MFKILYDLLLFLVLSLENFVSFFLIVDCNFWVGELIMKMILYEF